MGSQDMIRGRQTVVPFTNKSGAERSEGEVVIVDVTADTAFTTTTIEGHGKVIGVVAETIANNAEGRVITQGEAAIVEVDAATARGDFLKTSTTAGKATPVSTFDEGCFAIATTAVGAAGQVKAFLVGVLSSRGPAGRVYLTAGGGWPSTTNGCALPATRELGTNDVDVMVLAFDKDADEHAQWGIELAGWDAGTLTAKFIWTCNGGGAAETVTFCIQGRSYGDDEALDQAWGAAVAVADTWIADDDVHISTESAAITLAGTPAVGEFVQIRVYRDVSEDDLGTDAELLMVVLHYTRV